MLFKTPKISITESILDILQHSAETAADLFVAMHATRPESYRRLRRGLAGEADMRFQQSWSEAYRERKNFYSLLQQLKRDGLIENDKTNSPRSPLWKLTPAGRKEASRRGKEKREWLDRRQKSGTVIIVSYDIPEIYRRERGWLRDILKIFNFTMVHQSAWVGTTALPKEFIVELKERGILEYIEIFEVSKRGTIAKVSANNL